MAKKNVSKSKAVKTLEVNHSAMSLSFTWIGTQRTLTVSQKAEAAEVFGAEGDSLSAAKKLLDTRQPAFKKLTRIKGHIYNYWKWHSLPFPEDGIRLFRLRDVPEVVKNLEKMREEFNEAVQGVEDVYPQLVEQARQRLGTLFNPSEYPASLLGAFSVGWDFRNVQPPDYLMNLNPALFEEQKRRMEERFAQAVQMAEEAFAEELAKLVEHLSERLSGRDENGERNVFRNTAVTNLHDFFERFKMLNIRSNPQLDELVEKAQTLVEGVNLDTIRTDYSTRDRIASQMGEVREQLDGLMVPEPRVRIHRRRTSTNGDAA